MVAVDFGPRMGSIATIRRGGTVECHFPLDRSAVAPRRWIVFLASLRGLKPLKPSATVVVSLRETGRKCPNSNAQSWSSALRREAHRQLRFKFIGKSRLTT